MSKVALEISPTCTRECGTEATALRFFNVYGPDEGLDAVVPRFIAEIRATGGLTIEDDGEQRRDFNHVDDVVDMVVQIVQYNRRLHERSTLAPGVHGRSASWPDVLGLAGGGVCAPPPRRNEIADFVACARLLASVVDDATARSRPASRRVGAATAVSAASVDRQSA